MSIFAVSSHDNNNKKTICKFSCESTSNEISVGILYANAEKICTLCQMKFCGRVTKRMIL